MGKPRNTLKVDTNFLKGQIEATETDDSGEIPRRVISDYEVSLNHDSVRIVVEGIADVLIERRVGSVAVYVHGNDGDDDPLTVTTVIDQRLGQDTNYASNPVSVDSRRTTVKGDL